MYCQKETELISPADLRATLQQALAAPFYQKRLAGLGPEATKSLDDVRRQPFTTKDDLHASSGIIGTSTAASTTPRPTWTPGQTWWPAVCTWPACAAPTSSRISPATGSLPAAWACTTAPATAAAM